MKPKVHETIQKKIRGSLLGKVDIRHILGGIGKPTTQGKIERWCRTYDLAHVRFPLHRKFIEYYNFERPHMSLNYKTTEEVYLGSATCPWITQRESESAKA